MKLVQTLPPELRTLKRSWVESWLLTSHPFVIVLMAAIQPAQGTVEQNTTGWSLTAFSALSQASCRSPDDQRGRGLLFTGSGDPCWWNHMRTVFSTSDSFDGGRWTLKGGGSPSRGIFLAVAKFSGLLECKKRAQNLLNQSKLAIHMLNGTNFLSLLFSN